MRPPSTVSGNGGVVVKRLGDGAMAVFSHPQKAVEGALELQRRIAEIDAYGHTPSLRAGIHVGFDEDVADVLRDADLCGLLSDEGTMDVAKMYR